MFYAWAQKTGLSSTSVLRSRTPGKIQSGWRCCIYVSLTYAVWCLWAWWHVQRVFVCMRVCLESLWRLIHQMAPAACVRANFSQVTQHSNPSPRPDEGASSSLLPVLFAPPTPVQSQARSLPKTTEAFTDVHPEGGPALTDDPSDLIRPQECKKVEVCSSCTQCITHQSMLLNKHFYYPSFHSLSSHHPLLSNTSRATFCSNMCCLFLALLITVCMFSVRTPQLQIKVALICSF